jgi:hypothetical protein
MFKSILSVFKALRSRKKRELVCLYSAYGWELTGANKEVLNECTVTKVK